MRCGLDGEHNSFGGENRPTNWYEFMGRYQGSFGGLGVYGIPATRVRVTSTRRVRNSTGSVLGMQVWH